MILVCAGRSLLFQAPNDEKPHLWFILTDPEGDRNRVVAVMLRTVKEYTDKTIILEPGDHPFIKHSSSIHYSSARFFEAEAISHALRKGHCRLQEDMSSDLLRRAREGLLKSPFTVNAIKDYCRGRFSRIPLGG